MEADGAKKKKAVLPWGMTAEALQPNSVKAITKTKQSAFALGRMNPLKKSSLKRKEEREEKKKMDDAKAAADVFEEFVASFDDATASGKTFIRGSTFQAGPDSGPEPPSSGGGVYKPTSKLLQKVSEEKEKSSLSNLLPTSKKPAKKKGVDKKKSILELFRDELKRAQEDRKDRHAHRSSGAREEPLGGEEEEEDDDATSIFKVDEYKDLTKGSYDIGDPVTTNLYVGNINPKMNEEMLCQTFGQFGPLASVKVMWPRTEEEKLRKKNCGFVAFMKREHADKALDHYKGTTLMDYEVQVGWGKAVPLPPHPIYVPPDVEEEQKAKVPDPPSGLPFNAQLIRPPKEGEELSFEETLYLSIVRVVVPTDESLLRLIHRMVEFVVREGPMFEATIMNRELKNPVYQFLFDNQSPAHVYYRWKLFSILQGDSPETWRMEEFRMFEAGSLWKPPPLKKVRPPVEPATAESGQRRGQLTSRHRDDLEDQLRSISMERAKINLTMIWCLDHADSAEEIVDWITESLCIPETPLPMKVARLYLVSDILYNCTPSAPNSSKFRRGFEGKMVQIIEHFHSVYVSISSRIRAEQFKRRVLTCLRAWDLTSIYHFNLVDKLRELFIGKTQEEVEKQRAFDTVAALITTQEEPMDAPVTDDIDGLPLLDNTPIDFSKGISIDKATTEEDLDGLPLAPDSDLDGVPLNKADDIDGVPLEVPVLQPPNSSDGVRSKWELVDYDSDQDDEEGGSASIGNLAAVHDSSSLSKTDKQQLLAELDERKRKMLREVELKVVELSDALEASGSYSKAEIAERIEKFREKLMQEAVEPKSSPPPARQGSRSPSPTALAKYRLEESPKTGRVDRSPSPVQKRQRSSLSPVKVRQRKRERSRSPQRKGTRSPSPVQKRSNSRSPARKRSKSRSPVRKRSRSRSPVRRRSKSRSPVRRRSKSRSPVRKRSRSRSPVKRRSKSRSPVRRRSRSRSPVRKRSRSRSPVRRRSKSRSPVRRRSKSRSPVRKRSKSRSPVRRRSRSRSPVRRRSKSRSPVRRRSRSRSPVRKRSRSRSPKHRHRSRGSPKSHRHRSRSPGAQSSKRSRRKSRSRSPHKSKSSSKRNSKR